MQREEEVTNNFAHKALSVTSYSLQVAAKKQGLSTRHENCQPETTKGGRAMAGSKDAIGVNRSWFWGLRQAKCGAGEDW